MSNNLCFIVSDKLNSFFGSKDPIVVLYSFEVFPHFPFYASLLTAPFDPFANLPVHYIIGLLERTACCADAIIVCPSRYLGVYSMYRVLGIFSQFSDVFFDGHQMPV